MSLTKKPELRTPIRELEVVGYVDCIPEELLPSLVSPVFRLMGTGEDDVYLLPPYTLDGEDVVDGFLDTRANLDALVAQERVTMLEAPARAQEGYHLVVWDTKTVAYKADGVERLNEFSKNSRDQAWVAFGRGDMANAWNFAQRAVNAAQNPSAMCLFLLVCILSGRGQGELDIIRDVLTQVSAKEG